MKPAPRDGSRCKNAYGIHATELAFVLFVAVLLALVFGATTNAASAAKQPDILLIMPDQMRGECLSIRGHPVVRTPNIDALARAGALFRRAYTTCPSCIPARHSLLTGLYPPTSGVVGFAGRRITSPTLPKLLGDAGYTTVLVGRCMHQVPKAEPYGYQKEILGSTYEAGDDYDNYLKQSAPDTGGIRELVATMGVSFNGWEARPWTLAEDLHPTVWAVAQDRKTLKDAPVQKPLFLTASFFAPHSPLFPPKRFFEFYQKQKLPPAAHGDWVDWNALSPKGDKPGHRVRLEGEALRATQAGYFGLIEHLDEQIAPLIAEFKQRSEKAGRPWVIVFTTDHGEMLGDHGYFRKCEPYEGASQIPFIIAGSSELGLRPGLITGELVCLEDVMPTLLELAGVKPPPVDGLSLVPVLRGEQKAARPMLHTEHAVCYSKEQAFQMMTDGRQKYIWRPLDGSEQLFELEKDPREEHDLTKDPTRRTELESWRGKMIKELANRPEGFTDGKKLVAGRPYPPLQAKANQ